MGIDWSQYLAGMIQRQQPPSSSIFPATGWGNLASIINVLGVGGAYKKSQDQNNMMQQINSAKEFGLPGLRKLYADPKFQALTKSLGVTMPDLPPMSSAEIQEQRLQSMYGEAEAAAHALETSQIPDQPTVPPGSAAPSVPAAPEGTPVGGALGAPPDISTGDTPAGTTGEVGPAAPAGAQGVQVDPQTGQQVPPDKITTHAHGPVTPAEWRKIWTQLSAKYPAEVASTGILPRLPASVQAQLTRGALDPRTSSPDTIISAYEGALAQNGYSVEDVPDDFKNAFFNYKIAPYTQALIDDTVAKEQQALATAGLNTKKAQDLDRTFQARLALIESEINKNITQGDVNGTVAALNRVKTELLPMLETAQAGALTTNAAANKEKADAQSELDNANAGLAGARAAMVQWDMKYQQPWKNSLAGWSLRQKTVQGELTATVNLIAQLRQATPTENYTQDMIDQRIQYYTQQADQLNTELRTINTKIASGDFSGATQDSGGTGSGEGGGGAGPSSFDPNSPNIMATLGPVGSQMYGKIFNDTSRIWGNPKTITQNISAAFNALRKSPGAGQVKDPRVWDQMWFLLRQYALQYKNVDIGESPAKAGG